MSNGELIDARDAMDMLGIGENELQTLVARGDLRAFRSAGTMKFRRDDVMGLKSEKGTEPTIIIPASGSRKPGQSGILSSVGAGPTGSGINPSVAGGAPTGSGINQIPSNEQTGTIVFDDIDLMPTDDAMSTQQQTVVGSAITSGVGDAATIMDTAVGGEATGEMTVVDEGVDEAQVSTGPAVPITAPSAVAGGSGQAPAVPGSGQSPAIPGSGTAPRVGSRIGSRVGSGVSAGPQVSRVRQASVSSAPRRTATVYEVKTAHPIMTALLIINSVIVLFTASILGVMAFKGHYDYDPVNEVGAKERIIPPYLTKEKGLGVYEGFYQGSFLGPLPGNPRDRKPANEPDPAHGGGGDSDMDNE